MSRVTLGSCIHCSERSNNGPETYEHDSPALAPERVQRGLVLWPSTCCRGGLGTLLLAIWDGFNRLAGALLFHL